VTFSSIVGFPSAFRRYAGSAFPQWLSAFPTSRLLVFGRRPRVNASSRIILGPPLDCDELGIPYVDDFLHKSAALARADLLCLVSDDSTPSDFLPWQLHFLGSYFGDRQFAAIGRRCVPAEHSLRDVSAIHNQAFSSDVVCLSMRGMQIDLDEVPPFHAGMGAWDVWLAGWMSRTIPVVAIADGCASYVAKHTPAKEIWVKVQENHEMAEIAGDMIGIVDLMPMRVVGNELWDGERLIAKYRGRRQKP
jgi:hypothetical protein